MPATSYLPSPTGSLSPSLEASEVVAREGGATVTRQVQAKPDVQHPPEQSPATKNDSIQDVSKAKPENPALKGSADYKTQVALTALVFQISCSIAAEEALCGPGTTFPVAVRWITDTGLTH